MVSFLSGDVGYRRESWGSIYGDIFSTIHKSPRMTLMRGNANIRLLAICIEFLIWGSNPLMAVPPPAINDTVITHTLQERILEIWNRGGISGFSELMGRIETRECHLEVSREGKTLMTPAKIYRERSEGVLIVASLRACEKCGQNHVFPAGGFILTETGVVVTACHVINEPKNLATVVMTLNGEIWQVRDVLTADKDTDIALLQVDGMPQKPLPVSRGAEVGDPVTVISHPSRSYFTVTTGIVSRYYHVDVEGRTIRRMAITADFGSGSSGCPVFDQNGCVLGMVVSTYPVFHHDTESKDRDVQMVIKSCVPIEAILTLIQ